MVNNLIIFSPTARSRQHNNKRDRQLTTFNLRVHVEVI